MKEHINTEGCITITKDEAMKMINDFKGDSITVKIIQNQKETNKILVGDLEIGQTICNGKYVVVDRYTHGDTCIIRKETIKNIQFGETNNYSKSDLRKYLNTEYLKEIMNEFGEIELHTVDMLSMDGDDSYGKCKDLVSAMTFDRCENIISTLVRQIVLNGYRHQIKQKKQMIRALCGLSTLLATWAAAVAAGASTVCVRFLS